MARVIDAAELSEALEDRLAAMKDITFVTGPGRSGAIASVIASYILHVPFVPFGIFPPVMRPILIVDTTSKTGRTIRKAKSKYERAGYSNVQILTAFDSDCERLRFWYEFGTDEIPASAGDAARTPSSQDRAATLAGAAASCAAPVLLAGNE